MSPGVGVLSHCLILNLNFMLITSNVVLPVTELCLSLLTSLPSMFGKLVKMFPLVSVSFLALPRAVRRAMKLWDISGEGGFWKVQLDVRDLGGHLDFTYRARAGTLSRMVGEATVGVAAVGALPLGFRVKLGLVVVSIFLLASMLLRLLIFLRRPLVPFGMLLFVHFGLLRCLLQMLLPLLTFWMVLLMLILLFMLFGLGFA